MPPSDESTPAPDAETCCPPITDWGGEEATLLGRVVDRSGAPVAGARLEIWTPHLAENPAGVLLEATSGPDGRFAFPPGQSGGFEHVVVHGEGGRRVYSNAVRRREGGVVELGDLEVGPNRDVEVRVHCAGPVTPDASGDAGVYFRVFAEPAHELAAHGMLGTEPIDRRYDDILGGGYTTVYFRPDQRDLRAVIEMPVGRVSMEIDGSCGEGRVEYDVPAEGPALLSYTLGEDAPSE